MNEKALNALYELGFKPEYIEEVGHEFKYECTSYLLMDSKSDDNFLCIAIPNPVNTEDWERLHKELLVSKTNATLKYIKAYCFGRNVWLFYERELFEEEDLTEIIASMVMHLNNAMRYCTRIADDVVSGKINWDNWDNSDDYNDDNDN